MLQDSEDVCAQLHLQVCVQISGAPDWNTPVQQGNNIAVVLPQIPKQVNNRLSWIYSVVANVNEKWFAQWATTLCHCKTNSKDHMIDWCHFIATHQLWSVNFQLFLPGNRPSSFISYKPVRNPLWFFFLFVFLSQLLHQQNVSGTDLM